MRLGGPSAAQRGLRVGLQEQARFGATLNDVWLQALVENNRERPEFELTFFAAGSDEEQLNVFQTLQSGLESNFAVVVPRAALSELRLYVMSVSLSRRND